MTQRLAGDPCHVADWASSEVGALVTQAECLLWTGDQTGALSLLERARSIDAGPVERYSVGEALLRASNCMRGWDLYDLHPSRPVDQLRGVTRWRGEACPLLIIVTEQGFGDTIQFLRFVPYVVNRVENVVVAVHDELLGIVGKAPLLRNLRVIPKSLARTIAWPPHARWERLMSLPAKLPDIRVGAEDAYLRVNTIDGQPALCPAAPGVITVGLAWRTTHRRGCPNRSIPARLIGKLADSDRIRAVALHRNRNIRAQLRRVEVVNITNLVETAQVMSQCDWVVTADTVTAHLGAALGVPTIICLLHRPDWRWGGPSNPTRWYATAQTIFQDESRDWRPVLAEAARRILSGAPSLSSVSRISGVRK